METTTRWLSMLGIGTLCFGISLFVLRIPIRTIIVFFIIGVPLVALWLYVDARSKQQKKISSETTTTTQVCICSICKHDEARACFQENCACCLLTKEILWSDIPLIHCSRTSYIGFALACFPLSSRRIDDDPRLSKFPLTTLRLQLDLPMEHALHRRL